MCLACLLFVAMHRLITIKDIEPYWKIPFILVKLVSSCRVKIVFCTFHKIYTDISTFSLFPLLPLHPLTSLHISPYLCLLSLPTHLFCPYSPLFYSLLSSLPHTSPLSLPRPLTSHSHLLAYMDRETDGLEDHPPPSSEDQMLSGLLRSCQPFCVRVDHVWCYLCQHHPHGCRTHR